MYLCIDMRSFFASVECEVRGLNPLTIPLAVVDDRRGDGALVMAATPALKAYGVKSRCRLFDIPKDIFFIRARPRMKYYILYAKRIHEIFLRFVSGEDCLVYSIDESFLKIDDYVKSYGTPKAMALKIMNTIKEELHLYSTCGAGDNMYLAKISLDILAK
jgi:DNA polymerase V